MDSAGNVVEVEEEMAFDALPTAVKDGLRKKAGKGKVTKVESLTKRGKLVAYEAKVMTEGNKSEVQVGPGGEALDHEEYFQAFPLVGLAACAVRRWSSKCVIERSLVVQTELFPLRLVSYLRSRSIPHWPFKLHVMIRMRASISTGLQLTVFL